MHEFEPADRAGYSPSRARRRLRSVETPAGSGAPIAAIAASDAETHLADLRLAPGLRLVLALVALVIAALAGYVVGRQRPLDADARSDDDIVYVAEDVRESSSSVRSDRDDSHAEATSSGTVAPAVAMPSSAGEADAPAVIDDGAGAVPDGDADRLAERRVVAFLDDDLVDDFASYPPLAPGAVAPAPHAWLASGSRAAVRLPMPLVLDRSETWAIASIAFLASSLTLALADAPPLLPMIVTAGAGVACLTRLAAMLWHLEFGPKDLP